MENMDIYNDNNGENEEWHQVQRKIKNKKTIIKSSQMKLSKEDVINKLQIIFKKYNPHAVFLYGSTARKTNTEYSDIDILVIWKKCHHDWSKCIPKNIFYIKSELVDAFDRKIDLVNMIYANKFIDEPAMQSQVFLENVEYDAEPIYEHNNKLDIRLSVLMGKT